MGDIRAAAAETQSKGAPLFFTTGLDLLDLCVGGGVGYGFPAGYIVNFVGDKSAGKTLLAIEMLVANKYALPKFDPVHDDAESGCTFDTQRMYGIDLYDGEPPEKSRTIEEMDGRVGSWLHRLKGAPGIYVVDSLDGLANEDLDERAEVRRKLVERGEDVTNKGSYGTATPKFLSQEFFPTKAGEIQDKNALLVIVSQVRENMDPGLYKPKFKRSGGKALDFYAHTCLWLTSLRKIIRKVEGEERVVGVIVRAETKKSKTPRPYRTCVFSLFFDYGLDNIGTNVDYLFDLLDERGNYKPGNETINWSGEGHSFDDLTAWLKEIDEYDTMREMKKQSTGKANLTLEWIDSYIERFPQLAAARLEKFGVSMSREDLIRKIESDPEMKAELTRRVREKWEHIEASVASNRRSKYGPA